MRRSTHSPKIMRDASLRRNSVTNDLIIRSMIFWCGLRRSTWSPEIMSDGTLRRNSVTIHLITRSTIFWCGLRRSTRSPFAAIWDPYSMTIWDLTSMSCDQVSLMGDSLQLWHWHQCQFEGLPQFAAFILSPINLRDFHNLKSIGVIVSQLFGHQFQSSFITTYLHASYRGIMFDSGASIYIIASNHVKVVNSSSSWSSQSKDHVNSNSSWRSKKEDQFIVWRFGSTQLGDQYRV